MFLYFSLIDLYYDIISFFLPENGWSLYPWGVLGGVGGCWGGSIPWRTADNRPGDTPRHYIVINNERWRVFIGQREIKRVTDRERQTER